VGNETEIVLSAKLITKFTPKTLKEELNVYTKGVTNIQTVCESNLDSQLPV